MTNFVISNFLTIFLNAFLLLSIIVLFIAINSAFSVFVFLLCITYIVAFAKIKAPLYASSYEKKEADSKIFELINSQIEQIFEIQLNADYYKSKAILNNNFKLYLPKALQVGKFTYLFSSIDSVISVVFQSVLFVFAGIEIIYGKMTVGEFIMINSYFSLLLKSVKYFVNIMKQYQEAKSSFFKNL